MFIKWVTVSGTDRIVLNIFRCDLNTAPLWVRADVGNKNTILLNGKQRNTYRINMQKYDEVDRTSDPCLNTNTHNYSIN